MERVPASKTLPDVSSEERASSELVKRIRKLRWLGMEPEAAAGRAQSTNGERASID